MSRKRKTPPLILEMMEHQQRTMRHVDEVLRIKSTVPIENQANHVKSKPDMYWIGLADGCNAMLEEALFRHNCYAGFQYQSSKPVETEPGEQHYPIIHPDCPDYAGWRRVYCVRA